MPFPWKKKNNATRFSQLVADLHHSPKRASSLVVHTGFPTSLIDLFVKNRTRFTKPNNSTKPVHVKEFTPTPPPPPPPSPVTTPIIPEPAILNKSALTKEVSVESSGRVCECGAGSGGNSVVAVSVKMFVVLVLILSARWITVGITVSAFALLFLEYAGKRVAASPFSNANVAKMESFSKRVSESSCVFRFLKLLLLQLKKADNNSNSNNTKKKNFEVASVQLGSIDEIEVAEIKSEVGICCEESFFLIDGNGLKDSLKLDCDDDDDESSKKVVEPCGISKCKSRGNSSGRFKSKMVKKLVPKKFRGYNNNKKEKKEEKRIKEVLEAAESGSEISSAMDEEKSHSFEVDEEERESQSLLKCVRGDDKGINCSKESILAKEEEVINEKRIVIERDGNSGYTILLVTALVGLVVGRFQALILTITWCLVLKIVKTLLLLWRSHNCVPLVKFSVSNS